MADALYDIHPRLWASAIDRLVRRQSAREVGGAAVTDSLNGIDPYARLFHKGTPVRTEGHPVSVVIGRTSMADPIHAVHSGRVGGVAA